MRVSQILNTLPRDLEWMVLFNLEAVRQITTADTVRAMYHLPPDLALEPYSHVVLTSLGRFVAPMTGQQLVEPTSGQSLSAPTTEPTLAHRFARQLALFSVDTADCLGLGEIEDHHPVLLHIVIQAGVGQAQAVFDRPPSTDHYELLPAVGVKFLGGTQQPHHYLAQFQNRLPVHIHAGMLSHFSRTAHCNVFFLRHGDIDATLEAGLLQAAQGRLTWGHQRSVEALSTLAQAACDQPLPMLCQPPYPERPFAYGDLVPLGFVLRSLKAARPEQERLPRAHSASDAADLAGAAALTATIERLQTHLRHHRQGSLWAFHQGRLVTATDAALVLQGLETADLAPALTALQPLMTDTGGYVPQLWAADRQPERMAIDDSCRHWCQPDYATTALIASLQARLGHSTDALKEYLAQGFENRSGLYFANPYLVDWVLAQALQGNPEATALRSQLQAEVLASMNPDYSFGQYDVALSTALAIVTLQTLGDRSRAGLAAQLRLLELIESDGRWPLATPFYSSLRLDTAIAPGALAQQSLMQAFAPSPVPGQPAQRQLRAIAVDGATQYHSISLYLDVHRLIATAVAALALRDRHLAAGLPLAAMAEPLASVHPRYQCRTPCDYIAKFALPPYLQPTRFELASREMSSGI